MRVSVQMVNLFFLFCFFVTVQSDAFAGTLSIVSLVTFFFFSIFIILEINEPLKRSKTESQTTSFSRVNSKLFQISLSVSLSS